MYIHTYIKPQFCGSFTSVPRKFSNLLERKKFNFALKEKEVFYNFKGNVYFQHILSHLQKYVYEVIFLLVSQRDC